jgi:hypothetical protein
LDAVSDAQFGWLEYPVAVGWRIGEHILELYAPNGRGSGAPWGFTYGIGLNVGGIFIEMENTTDALPPTSMVSSKLPPHVSPPPIVLQHPISPCPKAQTQGYVWWRYATYTTTHVPLETTDGRVTVTVLSLDTIRSNFKVPNDILVISGDVIVNSFYIHTNVPNIMATSLENVQGNHAIPTPIGETPSGNNPIPISGGGSSPVGFFTIRIDMKKMVIL